MSLDQLLEDGVIDEVVSRLKSGKEADVWLVRHGTDVLCAKVYKDRHFRSFKNNAGYKEGRTVRNSRTQRAIDRGSRFGQEAAEDAWKSAESDALHRLHAEGVRVPAPVTFYEGTLLMRLVVDAEGQPAPRLIDTQLTPEEAERAYADVRASAIKMLCCDLIHGDLSPYNLLLGADGPTIIDLPQVISAAHNSSAEQFFTRDIENVRGFFAAFAPALAARAGDAAEIWSAYVRRQLTADFVPTGRLPAPKPRHEHGWRQERGAEGQQRGARPAQSGAKPWQRAAVPSQPGAKPAQPGPRSPQHGARPSQRGARPAQPDPRQAQQAPKPAQPDPRPAQHGARPPRHEAKFAQPWHKPAQPASRPAQHGQRPARQDAKFVQPGQRPAQPASKPAQSGPRPAQPGAGQPQRGSPPARVVPVVERVVRPVLRRPPQE